MSDKLNKFKEVLREVFQMDQADLDFGIYRIMNQKRDEIEKFLDQDLLPQVKTLFEQYRTEDTSSIKEELDRSIESARSLGVDPNTVQRVRDLQEKYSAQIDTSVLENQVFSHLTSFFRRYYDKGDFISQRRYKKDVYAIPYEGEEVKLHWANYDQYYIKTSEYFKNYTFKLNDGKKVHFIIEEASTEQNNNRAADNKERKFFIKTENPLSIDNGELFIRFRFDVNDAKQKKLNETAYEQIKTLLPTLRADNLRGTDFNSIFELKPTQKNSSRTLIEKHLNDYTARNTFDYFIHKDLGGFLKRELDFYIKNEVLYIDDINELDEKQFHKQVATIKVMKQIGQKIISFLEQLENFQKKLWLKKKFVVETNYCITLDRVPRELYPEIISNVTQVDEWKSLFNIDEIQGDLAREGYSEPLTERFLDENQFLILDTKFFSDQFKTGLLKSINNLDELIDGLLIHSENFQAINLLLQKYKEQVKCIYIDPPYNSKSTEILYKNTFKHSSWLALLENRLTHSKQILANDGSVVIAIDENEQERLGILLDDIYPNFNKTCVAVVHNPAGVQGKNFSYTHESSFFVFPQDGNIIGNIEREEDLVSPLRDWGGTSSRSLAKNCFYPIIVSGETIIGFGDVCEDNFHPQNANIIDGDQILVYPIDNNGNEKKWVFSRNSVENNSDQLFVKFQDDQVIIMRRKSIRKYRTVWDDNRYYANIYGSKLLSNLFGSLPFSFPKSVFTIQDSINALTPVKKDGSIIFDFFAGSGTTGHAVINLNREDKGKRKYILIEMGEYFKTVTKPRIQKVIYSKDWREGKPVSREGISQCFKYLHLESYEDTLNNLELSRSQQQQQSLEMNTEFREGYMLSYMLGVESEGSSSLLNIEKFEDPFNYYLKITRDNETVPTKIDLVETFNYLIGLVVETIDVLDGYKVIIGHNLENEKILIIWRNLKEKNNEDLNSFFGRIRVSIHDSEFDQIYVNGDNHLENMKIAEEKWKVVLIEEEFKKRMFENIG